MSQIKWCFLNQSSKFYIVKLHSWSLVCWKPLSDSDSCFAMEGELFNDACLCLYIYFCSARAYIAYIWCILNDIFFFFYFFLVKIGSTDLNKILNSIEKQHLTFWFPLSLLKFCCVVSFPFLLLHKLCENWIPMLERQHSWKFGIFIFFMLAR